MSEQKKDKNKISAELRLFFENEWNEWEDSSYINFVGDYYVVFAKAKPPVWTLLNPSFQNIYFFYLVDKNAVMEKIERGTIGGRNQHIGKKVYNFRCFHNQVDMYRFGVAVLSEYFVDEEELTEVLDALEEVALM
ncbi:hypothetical protein PB1_02590 [Bacillus methanolicus PB1]|uniref:Uncharacterized protein n=1 Tax=Bacillus methanolicus PB1 TaxID=997296 RepID=I3E5M0_BACMT|nr:hypothetical protein [Bacillus methanolicus]EIJ81791.1 hypothetical protein PB1_02590 [Bacillus methanolicus PB1]